MKTCYIYSVIIYDCSQKLRIKYALIAIKKLAQQNGSQRIEQQQYFISSKTMNYYHDESLYFLPRNAVLIYINACTYLI